MFDTVEEEGRKSKNGKINGAKSSNKTSARKGRPESEDEESAD